jgi:excisionase family DNA binding protein
MTAVSTVGKLLLTPEEAAGVLSIGRTKLYELLSSDEIVSIRVGTARRIPVEALQQFVDQLLDDQHPDGPRTSR